MITKLKLTNFRCHDEFELTFSNTRTFIYGFNGSGKSSIIEAICIASKMKSFRTNDLLDIIKQGCEYAKISVSTEVDTLHITITPTSKRLFVNQEEIKRYSNFVGRIHAVTISKEDDLLINGSPSDKRQFLNVELYLIDNNYKETYTKCDKLLKERNYMLKQLECNLDVLNVISNELLTTSLVVMQLRDDFTKELTSEVNKISFLKGLDIVIKYEPNATNNELKEHLLKDVGVDIKSQVTTKGVHRDDMTIYANGKDISKYYSMGEQKMVLIGIKLALVNMLVRRRKEQIVLLVDDLFSELDSVNKERLLNSNENIQIIANGVDIPDNDIYHLIKLGD
jgi:DNA replication and repair protein RecF